MPRAQEVARREVEVRLPAHIGARRDAPGSERPIEFPARENIELVEIHAVDACGEQRRKIASPERLRLPRQPVDEVDDDRHIVGAEGSEPPQDLFARVEAPHAPAQLRIEGLHAERDAVDPAAEPRLDLLRHEVVDAPLHRHLAVICQMEFLADSTQQPLRIPRGERGRRPPAEKNAVDARRLQLLRLCALPQLTEQVIDVVVLRLLAGGILKEVAVEALRPAEGNVQIDRMLPTCICLACHCRLPGALLLPRRHGSAEQPRMDDALLRKGRMQRIDRLLAEQRLPLSLRQSSQICLQFHQRSSSHLISTLI